MIYFLSFLLFICVGFGGSNSWHGSLALTFVIISLVFAILKVGEYL